VEVRSFEKRAKFRQSSEQRKLKWVFSVSIGRHLIT